MKHQQTTPAQNSQQPNPNSRHNQHINRNTTQTNTQQTLWDFVQPIINHNPPEPVITIPGNTNPDHDTQTTQDMPPATPIPIIMPDSQNDPPLTHSDATNTVIQQPLQSKKSNCPWGDTIIFQRSTYNFRVVSKNTGTLNPYKLDMTAITAELMSKGVSVFTAQETNINWNPATTPLILSQARRVTPHIAMATSTSIEETENWYKPGGTLVMAMNHCTSQIIA